MMGGLLDQPVVLAPFVGAIPHKGNSMIKVPLLPLAVRLSVNSCTICSAITTNTRSSCWGCQCLLSLNDSTQRGLWTLVLIQTAPLNLHNPKLLSVTPLCQQVFAHAAVNQQSMVDCCVCRHLSALEKPLAAAQL